jgi:hypothetical protein
MLRPLLIVGVGGSGGKTVRRLRQSLQRQLRRVPGWTGEIPKAWQMVWIDWPPSQGADGDSSPLLPASDYFGLWPSGAPAWSNVYPRLQNALPNGSHAELLSGWFDPNLQVTPAGGGQARAAGRNLGAIQMTDLVSQMRQWHSLVTNDGAMAELGALERCLGIHAEGQRPEPMAFVISSLAGGTGAGLFMEVLTAMHAVDDAYAAPAGTATMLYTADVFGSLNAALVEQVAANGLAAAMEVTSGVLSSGRSQQSMTLLSNMGVLPGDGKFACTYNFLIGRTNSSGVAFSDQNDVYQAVGECLSTLVLDDSMLDDLVRFPLLAAFTMVAFGDNTRMRNGADPTQTYPFSGIGLAKVALGTDRLGDYAAQLLTRDIVEQLMWPAFVPDEGQDIPDQERVTESADNNFSRFLEASGLNEINPANEVLRALAGDEPVEMPNQPFDLIYSRGEVNNSARWAEGVVSHAPAQTMNGAEWQQTFDTYWSTQRAAPLAAAEADLWTAAQEWTSAIQDRLTDLAARSAVDLGLKVTDELLTRLRSQVQDARRELSTEAAELAAWSEGQLAEAHRHLSLGKAKMTSSDGSVTEAIANIQNGILFACAARRHEVAAELLEDLATNLLEPLQTAIQTWMVRLSAAISSPVLPTGQPNPWSVMPRYERPTPTQFMPGPVEKLLISPESFGAQVEGAVKAGLPEPQRNSWRILARQRAGLGLDLATGDGIQTLLRRTADWVPVQSKAATVQGAPTRAAFDVPMDHIAILEGGAGWDGIESWLASDTSAELGSLLKTDLHTYVNSGDPATRLAREQSLIGAFTEATLAAAPLVSINAGVANLVHGRSGSDFTTILSPIPFPPGDPLHDRLRTQLITTGLANEATAERHFKTRAVDSITFLTSSANAMQAVVFDNVMEPAASDWMKRRVNRSTREIFWRWRRARPLTEALPLGRDDMLPQMLRGWFVADILGQRRVSYDRDSGPKVEVWCASDGWQSFPYPLLARSPGLPRPSRRGGENFEYLTAVLKSLALALVEVYNSVSLTPLMPYHRLLDLGGDVQNELGDWIDEGTPESPEPDLAAGTSTMDPDQRQQAVIERLESLRAEWDAHLKEYTATPKDQVSSVPASFEVAHEVMAAIDDILTVAKS